MKNDIFWECVVKNLKKKIIDSRVIEVIYFMHITRLLHIKKYIYIFSLYIGDEMMFSQNYFNFGKKFHIFFFIKL